jgi:uncharacterized membrane protein
MDVYLLDWVNLLLRWTHVIVAIAWIGSSFYFVFLDSSLTKPSNPELINKGVDGELWAVHGGGFYNPQKYMVAPQFLPKNLHWFYWESYSTWLSGFALFTVMYLFNAGTYLIDKSVYAWSPAAAVGAALGFLAAFWFLYDTACRLFAQKDKGDLIVGAIVFVLIVLAAWISCQLFAGRAAFLLVGAMIATAMSANVFVWIIPGQRTVIAQMQSGQPVDPIYGKRAKQRSIHNTYFTLPVLIAMLSNHYGWLYQGQYNWLVLVLIMLAGALIRHSFVARHRSLVLGEPVKWWHAIAGGLIVLSLVVGLAPAGLNKVASSVSQTPVSLLEVKAIVDQRCVVCHNAQVQNKGVALHTPELIKQHAQAVYQQVVVLKVMPMNNSTQITQEERAEIGRWFEGRR